METFAQMMMCVVNSQSILNDHSKIFSALLFLTGSTNEDATSRPSRVFQIMIGGRRNTYSMRVMRFWQWRNEKHESWAARSLRWSLIVKSCRLIL